MKLLAPLSVAASAVAASHPAQQVLKQPARPESTQGVRETFSSVFSHLPDIPAAFESLSSEARAAWDEVANAIPDAQSLRAQIPQAKKARRRPDSHWDAITRGEDLQTVTIDGTTGQRTLDGKLEPYTLRSKKVDPSKLGVDPGVKQYSGYLDDDENDKHLFYCE